MSILVVIPFAISLFFAQQSLAQSVSSTVQAEEENARNREILASFNKTKHEAREKFGIRREKYKQIHSEPVVKSALLDYAGNYSVPDLGYIIHIAAIGAGVVVTGSEPQGESRPVRRFHLENASLEGALLAGTKVYDDGERTRFEGLFINMTDTEGVSPTQVTHRATTFGLGVVGVRVNSGDVHTDKLFYQFER
jgi:hypothetical protein